MKILIVIPAYNEAKIIGNNLQRLSQYLTDNLSDYDWKILVADNCSTDQTRQIVEDLRQQLMKLAYLYIAQKGKGLAVISAWQKYQSDYDVFCFMDADLATDLSAFRPLINAIENGNDLAIGSRYLKESQVKRSILRKVVSAGYRQFVKTFLGLKILDLPCGFKAVNRKVVQDILPEIKNKTWFFDSEMLFLAAQKGYKIKEIPVKWSELRTQEGKSKVNICKVSWLYLKEIFRLKFKK